MNTKSQPKNKNSDVPSSRKDEPPGKTEPRWSVVVVGGGPAGMMSAISAATMLREQGSPGKVLLLEKNDSPGRKLLITGNGRCNITNVSFCGGYDNGSPMSGMKPRNGSEDTRGFCEQFGRKGRSLMTAMRSFSVLDTMRFFEGSGSGLPLKTEAGGRVFPVNDRASDVLDALVLEMKEKEVTVQYNATIEEFEVVEAEDGPAKSITVVHVIQGGIQWAIRTKAVIIATGGRSYPATGSSGDGYELAGKLGHSITSLRPGLVSLRVREEWVKDLQGVSISGVRVTALRKGKKLAKEQGEILFTHDGLSGPAILNLSRALDGIPDSTDDTIVDGGGECDSGGGEEEDEATSIIDPLILRIDLLPKLDPHTLDLRLQEHFSREGDRMAGNCLTRFVPRKVSHMFGKLGGVDNRWKINAITREQRQSLIRLLKGLELRVVGHGGWDRAMVTMGGVNLKEIDLNTMRSKLVKNLFFAGEVLDLDGPSGGYNLQLCWSTGHLAGLNAGTEDQ